MAELIFACVSAFWLGILTSISPCPLATNIAAVSFLSKRITEAKFVFWSGFLYTVGRMLTYAVLGFIIIFSLLSVPATAVFLQKYMNKALGPVLIVVGVFLLDMFQISLPSMNISGKTQDRFAGSGLAGSFLLGLLFALAFCPVSAALYFGSLIPLSLNTKGGSLLPVMYGIGTGLPVMIFAVHISLGVASAAKWFNKVAKLEKYARKITGVIFIAAGVYFIAAHILYLF